MVSHYDLRIPEGLKAGLDHAGRAVRAGQLILFPTDTLYGLGADAFNPEALQRVFEAKGRPDGKPLLVLIPGLDDLNLFTTDLTQRQLLFCRAVWPGPVTLLLPARPGLPTALVSSGKIGLRVPGQGWVSEVLAAVGTPLVAPSANRAGAEPPTILAQALEDLGDHVAVALDGGPCLQSLPSTLMDVSQDPPVVLRKGAAPEGELLREWGKLADERCLYPRPSLPSEGETTERGMS